MGTQHRKFDFEDSCFFNWVEDNDRIIRNALNHDNEFWKVIKMTKDPALAKQLSNMI